MLGRLHGAWWHTMFHLSSTPASDMACGLRLWHNGVRRTTQLWQRGESGCVLVHHDAWVWLRATVVGWSKIMSSSESENH